MLLDLARALPAALLTVVLPGYFWASFLRPTRGLGERLAYSTALSMALVPALAFTIARVAGIGVTLWVAVASVVLVFGSGGVAVLARGSARTGAEPVLPAPRLIQDRRVLALAAGALVLALVVTAVPALPGWLLGIIALALLAAGALASRSAGPADAGPGDGHRDGGPGLAQTPSLPGGPAGGAAVAATPGTGTVLAAGLAAGTVSPAASPPAGGSGGPPGLAVGMSGDAAASQGGQATAGPVGALAAQQAAVPTQRGPHGTGAHRARSGETAAVPTASAPGTTGTRVLSLPTALRGPALTAVLVLTALRSYVGVVLHDWPYLRGSDLYSHAVMAEQMMAHGNYNTYLIYPPGFSTLTAVVCRLSGLPPLAVFPVLAPALLVVTALGSYALATRLWGWEYGVAAAALTGLVLVGAYEGFAGGRYPDLIDAYFLVTMAVAALVTFYQSPSARSGALLTLLGGSVVFYHSVATLYLAVLMALVGLAALGYLVLKRERAQARALLLALIALAALSAVCALVIYGLPKFLGGGSATATAVSIALGSQPALAPGHLLAELAPAVVWLGAFGIAMVAVGVKRVSTPAQVLTIITMVIWCLMMYLGSRTAVDGFPQRFERDLGAPLAVVGALALGVIVMSAVRWRWLRPAAALLAVTAAAAGVVVLAVQVAGNLRVAAKPGTGVITPAVAAAGTWLGHHNPGSGTIISTPYMNPGISNRAVLAMGGYTGLQSYEPYRIAHPRSLPTAGRQPLLDSRTVLMQPASCQAAEVLIRDDVKFVVLYRIGDGADLAGFASTPALYRPVYSNRSVIIYQPTHAPCRP